VFQLLSKRVKGRKFDIRLGVPWSLSNPEHRWDVFLSFVSFIVTLGFSLFFLDVFMPLKEAGM